MIVQLGIYSRTFERSTLGGVLDAVVEHGFEMVHLNLRSAGLPSLPDRLRAAQCEAIHRELTTRNLQMAGLSATFNAVHPDRDRRSRETRLAQGLIAQAPELGTRFVSLSSGTRNQQDMWAGHPDNDAPSAWRDLLETMTVLLKAASDADVKLGIEPEHRNVVSSAKRARLLLDELRDAHLGIIFDAANLLTPQTAARQRPILTEAFEELAGDVLVVHAKDFASDGDVAAGRGLLDYDLYFELIAAYAIEAPVIIHEVPEGDVTRARDFVLARAANAGVATWPNVSPG